MLGGAKDDIQRKDSELKKYGLLSLGVMIMGITLTAGVTAAYLIAAIAAFSAAILYPDNIEKWFNSHRMLLVGSLAGFFVGGASFGPITMVLGGFLGHLVEQPVNVAVNAAHKTAEAYQKVSQGVAQVTELPNNTWNSLKSGFEKSYRYFAGEDKPAPKTEPAAEPKSNLQAIAAAPVPAKSSITNVPPKTVKTQLSAQKTIVIPTESPIPTVVKSKQTQIVKRRIPREPVKPVRKSLGTKTKQPSTQSLWQSFCSYFVSAPKEKTEDVLNNKTPTHLPLKNQLARKRSVVQQPTTKQQKRQVTATLIK